MKRQKNGRITISATDVTSVMACQHLAKLELDVLRGERERPNGYSSVTTRLVGLGEAHESAYLERLRQAGRSIIEVQRGASAEADRQGTLEAMQAGAEVIYQGVLTEDTWFGRTDFLLRVETPSRLGTYSYEVVDTKLSLEPKGRAVLQLCLYSKLLETAQGARPLRMHLVLGNGEQVAYLTNRFAAYFRLIAAEVEKTLGAPKLETYPAPVEHCEMCVWQSSCEQTWRDDDDVTLVAGLSSRHREVLRAAEVKTVERLAQLGLSAGSSDIGITSFQRIREQARIQVAGRTASRPIYELLDETTPGRGLLALPEPSPFDLFVDLEGDPMAMEGGLEYLIGVTEAGPERGQFRAFWGCTRTQEKEAFASFMAFVMARRKMHPELHLYHYAPYEPAAFKRLAARHGIYENELDEMLRSRAFVDLYQVVRQGLRASVESYSIKRLEVFYGFERKASLKDAGSCLVAMAAWIDRKLPGEPDRELKQTIAAYNQDDCASTLALRDWLEERRSELQNKIGTSFPRPVPGDVEDEEKAQRNAEVDALEERLLRKLPADLDQRGEAEQATWMVAQTLDWHRREAKSGWWEYFRLRELSPAQLIEEPSALGGLEFVGAVGTHKKSTIYEYQFPEQEYRLDFSGSLEDPTTGKSAGSFCEIDEGACTIRFSRGNDSEFEHPTALIENPGIGTEVLRDSLMRLGSFVDESGIESGNADFGAERALLLRLPPRGADGIDLAQARTSDEMTELGCELALAVKGTVLAVQGPPGAGKTHLGSNMIVALVSAGNRVGIVANSHKVIGKLLEETCKNSEENGKKISCVQKNNESEPVHRFVKNVKTNAKVQAALDGGAQVVAGTSWLWAREDMRKSVDVLVVDEAGQLALASVLAAAQAANGLILLGDPQQLDQPVKGVHPEGVATSALGYLLNGAATMPANMGIFLGETWRMHPEVCSYISECFYEEKLHAKADLSKQKVEANGPLSGTGLRLIPVQHEGNTSDSPEEAEVIGRLVDELLSGGGTWSDRFGECHALGASDILIITPYNAQVGRIRKYVAADIAVGTVDKFQGQQAAVVLYSMATSSPQDAPRGMEFLFSKNRLNVAVSRARCVAAMIANPALFRVNCKTPRQMELANAFCRFFESAVELELPKFRVESQ